MKKIPVTRNFDKQDVIGFLTLQDGVDIPPNSLFGLAYMPLEQEEGKPMRVQVLEVSLIADCSYVPYVEIEEERKNGSRS